jgi:hypothetical protein
VAVQRLGLIPKSQNGKDFLRARKSGCGSAALAGQVLFAKAIKEAVSTK